MFNSPILITMCSFLGLTTNHNTLSQCFLMFNPPILITGFLMFNSPILITMCSFLGLTTNHNTLSQCFLMFNPPILITGFLMFNSPILITGFLMVNSPILITGFLMFNSPILITGGFFVECGALDGDKMSNTLFFERKRNWTGLLIEANPNEFEKLLMKGRNAYSLNACLNAEKRTGRFLFDPVPISGGLVDKMAPEHKKSLKADLPKINVQCFTFDSVMKALGHTHIDLFSLDVEGAEIPILQSIPFSDFTIDVILVEYFVVGSASKRKIKYNQIKDLLNQTQMYDFVGTIHSFDMLFVRKGILDEEKLKMWREKLSGKI